MAVPVYARTQWLEQQRRMFDRKGRRKGLRGWRLRDWVEEQMQQLDLTQAPGKPDQPFESMSPSHFASVLTEGERIEVKDSGRIAFDRDGNLQSVFCRDRAAKHINPLFPGIRWERSRQSGWWVGWFKDGTQLDDKSEQLQQIMRDATDAEASAQQEFYRGWVNPD